MHAFILAGGFATRLWPLTEKRAKPLLPIAGKPILSHLLAKIPAGIPVTVSTNAAFAEGFEEWKKTIDRADVHVVVEDTRSDAHKLGALGSVARWVEEYAIADDVLLLTGDNYLGFRMENFLGRQRLGIPILAAHDIRDRERAKQFGTVIVDPQHPTHIKAFEEKPKEPQTTLVSAGCAVLPKETLGILVTFAREHPDNMGGIFEEFLRQGIEVDCFAFAEPWLDIGSFASYLEAHRLLIGGKSMIDPSAVVNGSTLEGSVSIDRECVIEGSDLTDCIIFPHCVIRDCTLRNCVIDEHCTLEGIDLEGKMLREGTKLVREN
ncbi:MAG: NDP-sugar synthase [Candidatus Peregrinibacteria bacterium]|nr:NDP-sugar synthase [Candidatus Peregrinibacteria bacterium]